MNRGVSPIDTTGWVGATGIASQVGQLRTLVGDTSSIPLEPDEPGFADYATWGDDALAAALAAQSGSQLRAAGTLYLQLAGEYALQGRSIKTDDLTLDTKGRGNDLRLIAQSFFEQADAADGAAVNDFFQIVPFAGRAGRAPRVRPEATPYPSPLAPSTPLAPSGSLDGGSA